MLLALDQGGHSSRALLFDRAGEVLVRAGVEVSVQRHHDQVEQDPQEVLNSLVDVAERVTAPLDPAQRVHLRVGIACQRSSLVCWRRSNGDPLSPILSWQDRRGSAWVQALEPYAAEIARRSGLRLSPHYGASKLRWCWEELPEVQAAAAEGDLCWGPLGGFLLYSLCEEKPHQVDVANAQRTQLLDLDTLDWSPDLISRFGLDAAAAGSALPEICDSVGDLGRMRLSWGTAPVRVLTGDQSAVVFADGDPNPEEIRMNFGTGAFLQRASAERTKGTPALLQSVVHRRSQQCWWVLEGSINGAGAALQELATRVGWDSQQVQRFVQDWRPPQNAPLFLNGVAGLASPFWDPHFESRFLPESVDTASGTSPSDEAGAVVESILFLARINAELLQSQRPATCVVVSGGLTRSDSFCQALADLLKQPVQRAAEAEATARGVAWWLGAEPSDWSAAPPGTTRRFDPDSSPPLDGRYRAWCEAMPSISG